MGTRLWYSMWDANEDDDVAFDRRVSPLLKEIGDRCKVATAEVRQQPHEPTPAPCPAPARPVVQARAPVTSGSVEPQHRNTSYTRSPPSMDQRENEAQQGSAVTTVQRMPSTASSTTSGSFAEMATFIREERAQFEDKLEKQRQEWERKLESQRQEWGARLETQRQASESHWQALEAKLEKTWEAKLDAHRQSWEAKLDAQHQSCEAKLETQRQSWEAKLDAQRQSWEAELEIHRSRRDALETRELQARFEALHASKLISDDELCSLENLVIDTLEDPERASAEGKAHSIKSSLMKLSEHIASDSGLARQLRRKYI